MAGHTYLRIGFEFQSAESYDSQLGPGMQSGTPLRRADIHSFQKSVIVEAASALSDCRELDLERSVGRSVAFGMLHRRHIVELVQWYRMDYCHSRLQVCFLRDPSIAWIL